METMSGVDIRKVAELFRQAGAPSDSEEEDQTNITPANIGPSKRIPSKNNKPKLETDIWDCEALPVGQVCPSDDSDPRIQPEYEIVYKQKVASEDIFLQLGNKTPMTSSCEEMLIKIQLPGISFAEIQLDVKCQFIDVRCSKYRLCLPLPHPVQENSGSAAWDSQTHLLSVTLPMQREFDFVNF